MSLYYCLFDTFEHATIFHRSPLSMYASLRTNKPIETNNIRKSLAHSEARNSSKMIGTELGSVYIRDTIKLWFWQVHYELHIYTCCVLICFGDTACKI